MKSLFGSFRRDSKTSLSRAAEAITIESSQKQSLPPQQQGFEASADQVSDIIITACEVICESFDASTPPPKLSVATKGSAEVKRLARSFTRADGNLTKTMIEDIEDADVVWAAIVHVLTGTEELLSLDQLSSFAPISEESISEVPESSLDITVKRQRLLGAVFATAEQLIARSKVIGPIVVTDLRDIFLREKESLYRETIHKAESGLRYISVHNSLFFPFARAFYRAVQKGLPRDPVALWTANFPAPKVPQAPVTQVQVSKNYDPQTEKVVTVKEKLQDAKQRQELQQQTVVKDDFSLVTVASSSGDASTSNWGRNSEDWDAARKRLLAKQVLKSTNYAYMQHYILIRNVIPVSQEGFQAEIKSNRHQRPEFNSLHEEDDADMIESQVLDEAIRNSLNATAIPPPYKEFNFADSLEFSEGMISDNIQGSRVSVADAGLGNVPVLSSYLGGETEGEDDYDADADEFDASLSKLERARSRRQSTGSSKLIIVKSSIEEVSTDASESPGNAKMRSPKSSPREVGQQSQKGVHKTVGGSGAGFFSLTTIDQSDSVDDELKGNEMPDLPVSSGINDLTTAVHSAHPTTTSTNTVSHSHTAEDQANLAELTSKNTKPTKQVKRSGSFLGMFSSGKKSEDNLASDSSKTSVSDGHSGDSRKERSAWKTFKDALGLSGKHKSKKDEEAVDGVNSDGERSDSSLSSWASLGGRRPSNEATRGSQGPSATEDWHRQDRKKGHTDANLRSSTGTAGIALITSRQADGADDDGSEHSHNSSVSNASSALSINHLVQLPHMHPSDRATVIKRRLQGVPLGVLLRGEISKLDDVYEAGPSNAQEIGHEKLMKSSEDIDNKESKRKVIDQKLRAFRSISKKSV